MSFKIGDWVKDERTGDIRQFNVLNFNIEGCYTGSPYKLWQPQEGEFVISKVFHIRMNNSFEVIKWRDSYTFKCEPFIGALPTFLKDTK